MQQYDRVSSVRPFVKWVGGKRRSLPKLMNFVPQHIDTYVEPFVGGGAMLFAIKFKRAIINDSNEELINAYRTIRDDLDGLIEILRDMPYELEFFKKVRAWDRDKEAFYKRSNTERAARLIYLLKTCFNGLYRVSKKNYFNTPFGKLNNPLICDVETLTAVNDFLNTHDIEICNEGYDTVLERIPDDSFVYLDPPYAPLSTTSSFTSYQPGQWGDSDQRILAHHCDKLNKRKIKFMQSNSTAPICFDLYKHYQINTLDATRCINSQVNSRGAIKELVITNYDPLKIK